MAGVSVTETSTAEKVNEGEGSALSMLSKALDKLHEPPPTRLMKPQPKLVSWLARLSSSESNSMGDSSRGPSSDSELAKPLGTKPKALIERIKISSGLDSDDPTGNMPTTIVEGNISIGLIQS